MNGFAASHRLCVLSLFNESFDLMHKGESIRTLGGL
jgi:hypothetical protein